MDKIFDGKAVLITGGSYGIGQATAIAFAQRGAHIAVADWKQDEARQTQQLVEKEGVQFHFIPCDVSNPRQVAAMVSEAISKLGGLHFAFNNAGIEGTMGLTQQCSEENWDNTININLKGVWMCMKHQLAHMVAQGFGVIVNCSSVAGLVGFANLPAYVASKHGVNGLTKACALENAQTGVRVNAVCPGAIKTPMIDRVTGGDPEMEKMYIAMEPMGRFGRPEEIAGAVVWLCSNDASFVTGHCLPVDGALTTG